MSVLFNFRKPSFEAFSYSVMVLRERAYLLMSWRMRRPGTLRIPELHFSSQKRSGSAYIRLPGEHTELEICLSTLWRSTRVRLTLLYTDVAEKVDIRPEKLFRDLLAGAVYHPVIKTNLNFKPVIRRPAVCQPPFHTINFQYDH